MNFKLQICKTNLLNYSNSIKGAKEAKELAIL